MKKDKGKKIFTSSQEFTSFQYFEIVGIFIVFIGLILIISMTFMGLFTSNLNEFDWIIFIVYLSLSIPFTIVFSIILFMIFTKYLIVYDKGILIRGEGLFTVLKNNFIPFNHILNVQINTEEIGGTDHEYFTIYTKSQEIYKLRTNLVTNFKEVILIIKNRK